MQSCNAKTKVDWANWRGFFKLELHVVVERSEGGLSGIMFGNQIEHLIESPFSTLYAKVNFTLGCIGDRNSTLSRRQFASLGDSAKESSGLVVATAKREPNPL